MVFIILALILNVQPWHGKPVPDVLVYLKASAVKRAWHGIAYAYRTLFFTTLYCILPLTFIRDG